MRRKTDHEPIKAHWLIRAGHAKGMLLALRTGVVDPGYKDQVEQLIALCDGVPQALNNYVARRTLQQVSRSLVRLFGLHAG